MPSYDNDGVDRQTYERPNCGSTRPHDQHFHSPVGGLTLNCAGAREQEDITMLVTYGPQKIAGLLGLPPNTVVVWLRRYDDWPAPDSVTQHPKEVTRGWLPGRLPEWRAYADKRAARAVQYGKGPGHTTPRRMKTARRTS